MGKNNKALDDKILNLKRQQEEIREMFIKLQGAIEVLEQMKNEKNEKTD